MEIEQAGALALLMQPEALPALFATAEPDEPRPARARNPLARWPARVRAWRDRGASRRGIVSVQSAACW